MFRPLRSRPSALAAVVLALAPLRATAQITDLEARLERLDRVLEQERVSGHVVGMALAVVHGGELVHAQGFGLADLEHEVPVTPRTSFCIGSTTKAFTSMVLAMLESDGVLKLDDPPSKYLPAFHLEDAAADAQVTLIDLLAHRTGLTRQSLLWYGNDARREAIVEHVKFAKAWAPFRSTFLYNNVMFLSAGEVAARAAGKSWDALVKERIFDVLGMTESTTTRAGLERATMSKGYAFEPTASAPRLLPYRVIDNVGPAGSIVSDVVDLSKWLRFLLAGGVWESERKVSEASFDRLFQPANEAGGGAQYGLGWFLHDRGGVREIEHGGNIDGFSAMVTLWPQLDLGFVLLTNQNEAGLQQGCRTIVYETLTRPLDELATLDADRADLDDPGKPRSPDQLAPYVGRYAGRTLPMTFALEVENERLVAKVEGQPPMVLRWPDRQDRWRVDPAPELWFRFAEPKGDWVPSVTFHQDRDFALTRQEDVDPDLPLTVDQLFDLRAEHGGGDALAEVESVVLRGTIDLVHTGLKGEVTWASDRDGRACLLFDLGDFGEAREVAGEDVGMVRSVITGTKHLAGDELLDLRLIGPLSIAGDWRDFAEDVRVDRRDTAGRLPAIRVTLFGFGGARSTRLVDPDDGRLLLERGGGLGLLAAGDVHFEDYREVGGVSFPFRIWMENPNTGRAVLQFESATLDEELPEEWFEVPGDEG